MSVYQFKRIFEPIEIGSVKIRNRVYMTPHSLNYAEPVENEGWVNLPSDRHAYYYAERAKGGVGLMSMESVAVNPVTDIHPVTESSVYDPRSIPRLQKITTMVHNNGAKIFSELWHAGHHANATRNLKAGAVFNLSFSASDTPAVEGFNIPKALEIEEIEKLVEDFGRTAGNAKRGGFDGIELHATHGYLFNQFLSPFFNKRTDGYGGSTENRMRFMIEVLKRVREEIGTSMPLGVRFLSDEMLQGGLDNDALKEVAAKLEGTGLIDFLDVDVGSYHLLPLMIAPLYVAPSYEVEYISGIKSALKHIPVIGCVGRLTNLVEADKFLVEGRMDMVGGARGFMTEPELVNKSMEGRFDEIRTCIACNQYCLGRNFSGLPIMCVLNPSMAREKEWGAGTLTDSPTKKRVMVIGGGPAGMEAARVLALRGHQVTLYEKQSELGGQLKLAHRLPARDVISTTITWYERQLQKAGVKVVTGKNVDADLVGREQPDSVIVATGSAYATDGVSGFVTSPIQGAELPHVVAPEHVIEGSAKIGDNVLILDDEGFVTSVGVAEMLASQGKKVEMVTRWQQVGSALGNTAQLYLILPRLYAKNVKMTPDTYVKEIKPNSVIAFNIFTNEEREIKPVDTVVMVTRKRANNALYMQLKGNVKDLRTVGDCIAPRGIGEAIYEGHKVGREI